MVNSRETQPTQIRFGVIGAGLVSSFHIDAIRNCPQVSLVAVCDPIADRAEGVAAGQCQAFTQWRELLSADIVDAIVIAVPHHLHSEIACAFARRGVHVLLEKPMATSDVEGLSIAEACADHGTVLALAHLQRFLTENMSARDRIRSGEIGPVRMVIDRRTSQYEPGTRPPWFFDPVLAGGGIVMNVGIHCIDRIHYLVGSHTVAVTALISGPSGCAVETEACVILHLANGVNAVVTLSGTGGLQRDQVELIGDHGAMIVDHSAGAAFNRPEQNLSVVHDSESGVTAAFSRQLDDFVHAIHTGHPPAATAQDGLLTLRAVLATYESAKSGRTIAIAHTHSPDIGAA